MHVCVCVLCVCCVCLCLGMCGQHKKGHGKIIAGSFADLVELLLTTISMYVFVWWGTEVKLFKHISKLTHQFQIR